MDDRKLMQQALEALRQCEFTTPPAQRQIVKNALAALNERLARPEQESVACQYAKDVAMPEHRCAAKCQYAQPQMQPCAGRDCGSTNPNLHSAECFEDYEKSTGMAQPERIQLTVRDFVVTVGDIEDAVGTPMYWAEWPNKEQP